MIEIDINTPAFLFAAITLLMQAYTIQFLSLVEINKSTKAIQLILGDIEELNKENIFKDIFIKGEN
jgi:hypothetical protein